MLNKIKNHYRFNKERWRICAAVVVILSVVLFGFEKRLATLDQCKAVVSRYITAEYSETTISVCTNMDGHVSTCMDTDYWSEPASEVFTVTTVDGYLFSILGEFTPLQSTNAWLPPMPHEWKDMRNSSTFDRFKYHTDSKLHLFVKEHVSGETSRIGQNLNKTPRCLERLNQTIVVSTWYNITFSSNL